MGWRRRLTEFKPAGERAQALISLKCFAAMVGRAFHARQAYGQIFDPPGCPGVRCACGLRWHTGATCDVIPTKAAYMACLSQGRHCVRELPPSRRVRAPARERQWSPRAAPLPASHRCRPAASNRTPYTVDQAKIALSTAAVAPNSPPQSSIRRRLRRPAHPQRKPPHRQIPIDGKLSPGPRGFLPGRLSDAGPQRAQIGHHGPASETLHRSRPPQRP